MAGWPNSIWPAATCSPIKSPAAAISICPTRPSTPPEELSLEKDVYPKYNIILCVSTFSATAPLTAFAKRFGFRGATLHGLNDIILRTGLAVDYNEVSRQAEKFRLGLTRADL